MKNTLNFAFSASLSVFFIFSLTYLNDIAQMRQLFFVF